MRHTLAIVIVSALVGAVVGAAIAVQLGSDGTPQDELDAAVAAAVEDASSGFAAQLDGTVSLQEQRIASIFEQIAQSVLIIDAEGPERIDRGGVPVVPAALGTGFVLDADGHLVTAAHVIEGMTSLTVQLPNGVRLPAERIGDDHPFSDVAVMRIALEDADDGWVVPRFGDSASLAAGETVLALGNTILGEEVAVTVGVVSDPDTTFFRERYEQVNLIQTDAALNHGNSGGVLVDLDGNIVGMTAVIARTTQSGEFVDGIGFALQIDAVLDVARAIAAEGFYPRPTFGVVNERLLTPSAAAQLDLDVSEGAFLIEIERQGAFAEAGIRPGDVLRRLDGIAIDADTPYLNALATLQPNVPVTVLIHRGGEEYQLDIAPDLRTP